MGKKCSPQAFVGIPAEKLFHRGDGDEELFPGGEFPIAIPNGADGNRGRGGQSKFDRWWNFAAVLRRGSGSAVARHGRGQGITGVGSI
jgi:hypothetical protein